MAAGRLLGALLLSGLLVVLLGTSAGAVDPEPSASPSPTASPTPSAEPTPAPPFPSAPVQVEVVGASGDALALLTLISGLALATSGAALVSGWSRR